MRRSIGRPARALLPLALGALVLTGDGARAAALALSILAARLFSLGAEAAFQAATGKLVNEARLRGNFLTALLLALAGGAVSVWVLLRLNGAKLDLPEIGGWMALSGAAIMLAELFSARLYALTDKLSAPLCDALVALLTAAGLVTSRGDDRILFFSVLAALMACLVAVLGIGGVAHPRPGARVLAEIPRALVRSWVPAAVMVAFLAFVPAGPVGALSAAGWGLFSWAYAPARRTGDESGPVVVLTTLFAAASVGAAFLLPGAWAFSFLPVLAACLLTAFGTAELGARAELGLLAYTFAAAAAGWRLLAGFPESLLRILPFAAALAALIAAALVVPDILSGLRLARARRRRR